jgi:hypothetical protein
VTPFQLFEEYIRCIHGRSLPDASANLSFQLKKDLSNLLGTELLFSRTILPHGLAVLSSGRPHGCPFYATQQRSEFHIAPIKALRSCCRLHFFNWTGPLCTDSFSTEHRTDPQNRCTVFRISESVPARFKLFAWKVGPKSAGTNQPQYGAQNPGISTRAVRSKKNLFLDRFGGVCNMSPLYQDDLAGSLVTLRPLFQLKKRDNLLMIALFSTLRLNELSARWWRPLSHDADGSRFSSTNL